MHQLSGPDDAIKAVNFWLDQGVDNFKAYMFITPAELSAPWPQPTSAARRLPDIFARLGSGKLPLLALTIWNTVCWWTRNSFLEEAGRVSR